MFAEGRLGGPHHYDRNGMLIGHWGIDRNQPHSLRHLADDLACGIPRPPRGMSIEQWIVRLEQEDPRSRMVRERAGVTIEHLAHHYHLIHEFGSGGYGGRESRGGGGRYSGWM